MGGGTSPFHALQVATSALMTLPLGKSYLKKMRMEYRLFTTEEFQYGVVVKGGETVLAFSNGYLFLSTW